MEIARIEIVADENKRRQQALRREANSCPRCRSVVNFEVRRDEDCVLETTRCPDCGHTEDHEHLLQ